MKESKDQGFDDLIKFATDVIHRAGEEALSYFGKGDPCVKFDDGLVIEAELHLTEFFRDQLDARFPEHQVFKNNQDKKVYTHEENRHLWVCNALDGVANFQAGIPVWGISLALLENFWPIFGVFYMPATGDLFYAQADSNAYWGNKEISVSNQESIDDESLLLTYSRFHHHYSSSSFPGKIRDFGCTSTHICYVATGRAEAAIIANESYQDLAATCIIVEAAGGKIYKMDGNDFSLSEYSDAHRIDDHLIVAAPDICSQVRDYLKEIS